MVRFVTDVAGKRVLLVDLMRPGDPPIELYTNIDRLWGARPLGQNRLVIGAGDSLLVGELERERVELHVPKGLFISGWAHVLVRINDPAIAFDELDFEVEPQQSGAMVSYARDNSFDPARPTIMLTAGWLTGRHELIAVHRPSGQRVAAVKFQVLDAADVTPSGHAVGR